MKMVLWPLLAVCLLGTMGCNNKPLSAQKVAENYVILMKSGKYLEAAKLWDYETKARTENENWDDIVEGQRTQIINKLAEEKAETLKTWDGYFPAATKVVEVTESGQDATAALEGGRVGSLSLKQIGEEWRIVGMD